MEFVLEVRPPEGAMYYVALPESGILTIGREAPAEIVIRDRFLSRSHFQLQCAEMLHILTDPASSNGTYVNGMRVRQSVLRPRDAIYAGKTVFRLAPVIDGKVALDTLPESPGELSPWKRNLITVLETACNFAVLDGAISPAVRDLLNQAGVFYQSLYEGEQSADVAAFGPFLAEVQKGSPLIPFLIKVGWGKSWGVFLNTQMGFIDTRKHLRRFLMVDKGQGQKVLFRFYDPRVMRVFIPTCSVEQRREFFGQIEHFYVESAPDTTMARYSADTEEQYQLTT